MAYYKGLYTVSLTLSNWVVSLIPSSNAIYTLLYRAIYNTDMKP